MKIHNPVNNQFYQLFLLATFCLGGAIPAAPFMTSRSSYSVLQTSAKSGLLKIDRLQKMSEARAMPNCQAGLTSTLVGKLADHPYRNNQQNQVANAGSIKQIGSLPHLKKSKVEFMKMFSSSDQ